MSAVIDWQARRDAINTKASFCVVAPAGSGKTELLTQRLLALLGEVDFPEEILAITFTRKAAAEMQDRVIEAMQKALRPAPRDMAPHEATTRALAEAVLYRDKQRHWRLMEAPSRLRLRTIDGFCASIAQQLPMSAGFGTQMGVSENSQALYQQAVRDMLADELNSPQCSEELRIVLGLLNNRLDVFENLFVQLLGRRDQWLTWVFDAKHSANKEALYQQLIEDIEHFNRVRLDSLRASLSAFDSDLAMLIDFASRQVGADNTALRALQGIVCLPTSEPEDFAAWQTILSLLCTKEGQLRRQVTAAQGFPAPSKEKDKSLKALFQQRKDEIVALLDCLRLDPNIIEAIENAIVLVPAVMEAEDYRLLTSLLEILPRAAGYLRLVFAAEGSVDYIEVNHAANEALGDSEAPSDLALKLDYQIKHILLDEFQDTSLPQLNLLQKLTAEWQPHDGRTLFIVGDGMQSCYGFRDAKVEIFLNARRHGIGSIQLENLALEVNFRSQQGIVDWVNATFVKAFPAVDDPERGAVKFSLASAIKPVLADDAVQCLAFFGDSARDDEASHIIALIKQAQQQDPTGSIAVLVRGRSHLKALLPKLQAANIAWIAEDIDALQSRGFIRDLINLYCAINFSADHNAWLALLRSPLLGLSLNDLYLLSRADTSISAQLVSKEYRHLGLSDVSIRRLDQLSQCVIHYWQSRQRKPLAEALHHLWLDLNGTQVLRRELLPHTAQRDVDNFLTCLQGLLRQHPEHIPDRDTLNIALEKLFASVDSRQNGAVHLMTIHKSKGLEFDTVIIPALDRSTRANEKDLVMWQDIVFPNNQRGLLLAPLVKAKGGKGLYDLLRVEKKRREELEAIRLLYVGATRAINRLYLSAVVKEDSKGEVQAPSDGCLLRGIWESFRAQMQCFKPIDAASSVTLGPSQTNWRIKDLPAVNCDSPWQMGSGASNLPVYEALSLPKAVGLSVHSLLEFLASGYLSHWQAMTEDRQRQIIEFHMRRVAVPLNVYSEVASLCLQQLRSLSQDKDAAWILAKHTMERCEWRINDAQGNTFIIDRFFVDAESGAWIVDYKTAMPAADEDLAAFIDHEVASYRSQLNHYQTLLQDLGYQARCGIYFTAFAQWVEIAK